MLLRARVKRHRRRQDRPCCTSSSRADQPARKLRPPKPSRPSSTWQSNRFVSDRLSVRLRRAAPKKPQRVGVLCRGVIQLVRRVCLPVKPAHILIYGGHSSEDRAPGCGPGYTGSSPVDRPICVTGETRGDQHAVVGPRRAVTRHAIRLQTIPVTLPLWVVGRTAMQRTLTPHDLGSNPRRPTSLCIVIHEISYINELHRPRSRRSCVP